VVKKKSAPAPTALGKKSLVVSAQQGQEKTTCVARLCIGKKEEKDVLKKNVVVWSAAADPIVIAAEKMVFCESAQSERPGV